MLEFFNEEEKEAIELLKRDNTDYYYRSIDVRNSVKVALNCIDKLQKVIDEIESIIENEFNNFTSHDNNFNLGDIQLLEDTILDKINEKVEEENEY